MMKQINIFLVTLCAVCWGFTPGFGQESEVDQRFIFAVTNKYGQDILLIGPENKDIRIGVLGREFRPTNTNDAERMIWPVGVWAAVGNPPDNPASVQWKYTLTLSRR